MRFKDFQSQPITTQASTATRRILLHTTAPRNGIRGDLRGFVVDNLDVISAFVLLVLLTFLLVGRLLIGRGTILYADFVPTLDVRQFLRVDYPLWSNRNNFVATNVMRLPYLLIFYLPFYLLDVSAEIFFKFMIISTFLISGTSMYVTARHLVRRYTTDRRILFTCCFFPSVLYSFNPWAIDRVYHSFLLVSYSFLPLVFLLSIRILEQKKLDVKGVLALVLVSTVASADPHGAVFLVLLVLSLYVFYMVTDSSARASKTKNLLLFLSAYGLVSAFWILPMADYAFLSGGLPQPGYIISMEELQLFSRNSAIPNVLRLTAYWLPPASSIPTTFPLSAIWIVSSVMVIVLGYVALAFYGKAKPVVFLVLFSVPVVLLSSGTALFPQAYEWLVFQAPLISSLGWLFRDPNKWSIFLPLVYSTLLAYFMLGIAGRAGSNLRLQKPLALFVLALVASSTLIYVTPGVTNSFEGPFRPVVVPSEISNVDEMMQRDPTHYNVLWVPPYQEDGATWVFQNYSGAFELDSSAKPTFDSLSPNFIQYYEYLNQTLLENRTNNISAYLNPLDIRYIVFHNDSSSQEYSRRLYQSLLDQGDLQVVMRQGIITLFENRFWNDSTVQPYGNLVAIEGGFDKLVSLNELNLSGTATVFLDQNYPVSLEGANTFLLDGSLGNDTLALTLNDTMLLSPFDFTVHDSPNDTWSRSDIPALLKTDTLSNLGIQIWDYDYGKGIALTSANGSTLDMPSTTGSGNSDFFARILESPAGGSMKFYVDGSPMETVSSQSSSSGFVWRSIGEAQLGPGGHDISMQSEGGFNAVNLIAIVPAGGMQEMTQWASSFLSQKGVLYEFDAASGMVMRNASVSTESGGAASGGEFVKLNSASVLSRTFDTFAGDYTVAVRGSGSMTLTLDNKTYPISLSGFGWAYVGPLALAEGPHEIEVTVQTGGLDAQLDAIWLMNRDALGNTTGSPELSGKSTDYGVTAVSEVDPTEYVVQLHGNGQVVLSLSDAYDLGWIASDDGSLVQPLELFGVANGFLVHGTGSYTVTLEFRPQEFFYVGVFVSLATIIGLLTIVIAPWNRSRTRRLVGLGSH